MPDGNLPALIVTASEPVPATDDGLSRLIQMYEASEDASKDARGKAERDRDYVDNKQLTDEEVRKLNARGQPPVALNVIRSRAAFLAGMEKKQRRDPKAWPRNNPDDLNAAEAFTDGMRYVIDKADYASVRSQAWKNITVEGFGGVEVAAVEKRNGDVDITLKRLPWGRLFYDPHSEEPDFTDARYKGLVVWMDLDEALARATGAGMDEAEATEILESTMAAAPSLTQTYDDKPKFTVWADRRRKRVRIVMMWHRETDGWKYCEFTRAGKLMSIDGPYVDQDGETYCPWVLESANVDRDNNRYGEVRHLIDPQDEINKRRSKALHLLNVTGVIAEAGAVADINQTRKELARPDFYIEIQPGTQRFELQRGGELAAGQAILGQQAMAYMMEAGPNAALLGKGTQDQSGKAIEAQQAGGLVEQSDLMDTLRRMDLRVFTIVASMIKQFWTAEKWIRVTDDEDAPKWVGLNVPKGAPMIDPMTGEPAIDPETGQPIEGEPEIDPYTGQSVHGLHNDVAQLDMDILISDAPDVITPSPERYRAVAQMLASGANPKAIAFMLEMDETIDGKTKKRLTDMLDEMSKPQGKPPEAAEAERLQREQFEAKTADIRASAYQKLTAGEERMARIGARMPLPDVAEGMMDAGPQGQGPMPQGMPQPGPQNGPPMPAPMMDGPPPPQPQGPPPGPPQGAPMGQPGGMVGMMTGRRAA